MLPGTLDLRELAVHIVKQIDSGNAYARGRKVLFMRRASAIRVLALSLSAAATIILGLQDLDFWAGLGFSLVAVATAISGVEPFFAWRSRWVLMEEMQHKFYQLSDRLRYYVASHSDDQLTREALDEIFEEYQRTWDSISSQWLEHRRHGNGGA